MPGTASDRNMIAAAPPSSAKIGAPATRAGQQRQQPPAVGARAAGQRRLRRLVDHRRERVGPIERQPGAEPPAEQRADGRGGTRRPVRRCTWCARCASAITAKPSGSSTWNAHTGTPSVILRPARAPGAPCRRPTAPAAPPPSRRRSPARAFAVDRQPARRQQRSGRQGQQAVVAGGQGAAEQRHHQREVLHERRAAGDARVEPPQHDLDDRQQRQQRQGEHGEPVLERWPPDRGRRCRALRPAPAVGVLVTSCRATCGRRRARACAWS